MRRTFIWIITIAGVWAALFGVVWYLDMGCIGPLTTRCNDLPIEAAKRFIKLEWLESYQTLVAAALALAGAWLASRPVFGQLREMTRQSAAIAVANFRTVATEIEEELGKLKSMDRFLASELSKLLRSYDEEDRMQSYQYWPSDAADVSAQVFDTWQYVGNRIDRLGVMHEPSLSVGLSILRDLLDSIADLHRAFKSETTGPDYEDGEDDVSVEQARAYRQRATASFDAWESWYAGHSTAGLVRRREAWAQVRRLEDAAKPEI